MHEGSIEVICGPMFSGKTEELIRRLRRAVIARQKVQVFKPAIDTRYHETNITSHSAQSLEAVAVQSVEELHRMLRSDTQVVGIDEAQFFGRELVAFVVALAHLGVRVVIAGLDIDALERAFGPMPLLLAQADRVDKLTAVCVECTAPARHSHRISPGDHVVHVGATDSYEALCRRCYATRHLKASPP